MVCSHGLKINSQNDVTARLYPEEDPSQVTTINSYVEGLYVSDFPMTTASLYMNYQYELSSGSTSDIQSGLFSVQQILCCIQSGFKNK